MQTLNQQSISLKFILLTEELSFIPENILNCCQVIPVPRPSKSSPLSLANSAFFL